MNSQRQTARPTRINRLSRRKLEPCSHARRRAGSVGRVLAFCGGWLMVVLAANSRALCADPPLPEKIDFNRDVRPILADNCFACHGPDANHRKADLRLDLREAAIDAGAILAGDAAASPVMVRILSDDDDARMPPPSANKRLSARQRQIMQRWIDQGAVYQKHWAYEAPVNGTVPAGVHGVDHWVSRRLASLGLKPTPAADRRVIIRRLYADLIGLPPTPEEVDQFVNDQASDSYERLVDRVLRNPHYGERMAIGWLDVARFADTIGYHSDNPRNVWPYRDWVIRSFNENKPFDRFTLEQIAGDLLPDASDETRVGSAFNRLLLSTEEGGAQPKDYEARMLTDRVRAVGTAWLGQTTGCAQCHDHKFDPFTTRDFYSLGAFFADVQEPIVGRREEGMVVAFGDDLAKLQSLDRELAELKRTKPASDDAVKTAERVRKAFHDSLPRCLVTSSSGKSRVVRILPRGNWMDESGEVVRPALPHYLPQPTVDGRELNRLDLARWLVARDNPLTARVFVNRLWKQLFGAGLSRVVDDLGAQGEPPANPELLDWLACEFMDSGWNVKHLVKTIVLSETYRRSSIASPDLVAADPNNREWARQSPFRLDAELVRDYALAISGLLAPRIGGPSVKPYQPDGYWENLNFPTRQYVADDGESQYRRGVYTWWQRTFLHPSLLAFDAPSREECCADRPRSNIPQQALVLLNDPTYVEAARALASQVLLEGPKDEEGRIRWAWRRALQRQPDAEELRTLSELLARRRAYYQQHSDAASQLLDVGFVPVDKRLDGKEVAAWTHVARVLLNLHETITRP
ncbi:MAG: PSD1 and planctomycete cytochrome C domain-containing protein [Pirellulales bacterium]